ncbi:hypothetical protein DPSP01_006204 [Paraphaeosphaeria sporulosa]
MRRNLPYSFRVQEPGQALTTPPVRCTTQQGAVGEPAACRRRIADERRADGAEISVVTAAGSQPWLNTIRCHRDDGPDVFASRRPMFPPQSTFLFKPSLTVTETNSRAVVPPAVARDTCLRRGTSKPLFVVATRQTASSQSKLSAAVEP